jgi:hypothetical protein
MLFWLVLWLPCLAFGATDFDSLTIIDDCNRNEDPLSHGGQWTQPVFTAHTSALEATGNFCRRNTTGGSASAWWNADTFGPNVAISMTGVDTTTETQGVFDFYVTFQDPGTSLVDGYVCQFELVAEDLVLYRVDDEAFTPLQVCPTLSASIDDGDGFACERIVPQLKAYIRRDGVWTEECAATDATYTGVGAIGVRANKTDTTFDNVRVETLPVSVPTGHILSVIE